MSLAPIGTFIARFDNALNGSIDGIVSAMVTYAAGPIGLCAVAYYIIQGVKFAQGDAAVLHGFWGRLIHIGLLVWLTTNLAAFNYWVRDFIFIGIPNALNSVVALGTGVAPGTVTSTAAMFDNVWSQLWVVVSLVWMQMGFSVTGMLAGLVGVLTIMFGGAGLLVLAMVYIGARMVFAVIVCLTPIILVCGIFDATKGVVERAIGKAVALTILQVAGFIVMQIVLLGNQYFMAQATTAILSAIGTNAVLAETLQILLSICFWFAAGAYGMWELRAVAYSLGTGVSGGPTSLFLAAMAMRSRGGGGGTSTPASPSPGPGGGSMPALSISMARSSVSSASPPPALTHSTRS